MVDQKKLEELHDLLASKLLELVREGTALAVARQFLKDNGVDAPESAAPIRSLAEELPFAEEQVEAS